MQGEKARKPLERELLREGKLDVLAKMKAEGISDEEVEGLAKTLGVDMAKVTERQDEITKLALDEVELHKAELKMDKLHKDFLSATVRWAQLPIAREMAILQGKINAAKTMGPYITTGSVLQQVTMREGFRAMKGGRYLAMSPMMGCSALIGETAMLKLTIQKIGKEGLEAKHAKAWLKYSRRLLFTSGQFGVDFFKAKAARDLFETVDTMLTIARKDVEKVTEAKLRPFLSRAFQNLDEQLTDLMKAVNKNAEVYLAAPDKFRKTVIEANTKTQAELLAQRLMILYAWGQTLRQPSILMRGGIRKREAAERKSRKSG